MPVFDLIEFIAETEYEEIDDDEPDTVRMFKAAKEYFEEAGE